jgi:thymidylate synthase (FAD)
MRNKVELVGYYGGDKTHAQAAWTSTQIEGKEERIPRLLKMLAENDHGTPFERSLLHFSVTCDTASHIQFLKHRMFSINGESARYKEYIEDKYYLPEDSAWRGADTLRLTTEQGYEHYHNAVDQLERNGASRKRAKESARYYLPYAIQVNLDMSCNFRTFVHFQKLRNSEHAQLEIRELAQEMILMVREETNDSFRYSLEAWGL